METEIEFQYGCRPFSETGSSFIPAVDWDISSKFSMQIDMHLKSGAVTKSESGSRFTTGPLAAILKKWYDVISPPPIVGLLWNLIGGCQMACLWPCCKAFSGLFIRAKWLARDVPYYVKIWPKLTNPLHTPISFQYIRSWCLSRNNIE